MDLAPEKRIPLRTALIARRERIVAIRDFYPQPDSDPHRFQMMAADELLTAFHISEPAPGTRSAYQKYSQKESHDWAIADAGILLEMGGDVCRRAAVAMGAASRRTPAC